MKQTKQEPLSESYFYILLCLSKGANHGYGIMKQTEQLSEGQVKIGSGTMYGATSNMIKKGWIKEIVSDEAGAEKKRLYTLTPDGNEAFKAEVARLKRMLEAVGNKVTYLKRLKMGDLELDPKLEGGEYRRLTSEELELLKR